MQLTIRESGAKPAFIAADLATTASARDLVRRAAELGGGHVDMLANNAGVLIHRGGPFDL